MYYRWTEIPCTYRSCSTVLKVLSSDGPPGDAHRRDHKGETNGTERVSGWGGCSGRSVISRYQTMCTLSLLHLSLLHSCSAFVYICVRVSSRLGNPASSIEILTTESENGLPHKGHQKSKAHDHHDGHIQVEDVLHATRSVTLGLQRRARLKLNKLQASIVCPCILSLSHGHCTWIWSFAVKAFGLYSTNKPNKTRRLTCRSIRVVCRMFTTAISIPLH